MNLTSSQKKLYIFRLFYKKLSTNFYKKTNTIALAGLLLYDQKFYFIY